MKKILSLVTIICLLLIGCSKQEPTIKTENWEVSGTLVREVVVTDDGQKGDFVFRIGNNGKLGFAEYGPFIEGEKQKYMWHFWGEQKVLTQSFKVIAVSKETGENLTVFETPNNNPDLTPHMGADHHIPSLMMLPSPGLWKLKAYFGENLFGSVVINVEEK
ncbi:hypothetical protein [Halobacillus naozhouensis]|uniref:DUF4871 domain-containing protein n=1 Tax=Halobacillus naozhouensis TaxID=554880 RepID=A0ABY8IVF6_9BACI|nr:hypothetical protein [Halobacillus naozhouensis]WFT74175.1 hypothetical protein P9989_17690 [Halobacillus naozhouensis]